MRTIPPAVVADPLAPRCSDPSTTKTVGWLTPARTLNFALRAPVTLQLVAH